MPNTPTPRPGNIGDALTERLLEVISAKDLIAEWEKAFTDCVDSKHFGPDFNRYQLVRREVARRLGDTK